MLTDWPRVRVADCCDLIVDCVNKTAPVVDYETPFRMIRTTNIRNGVIDLSDCKFVEESTFKTWTRRAAVLQGDVILTREAPIGQVGLVRSASPVFLGQRLMQYRANRSVLDPRFLCYAFLSPELQHQFGAHEGSGSVVSHIRVGDCQNFRIPLPPLHIQEQIAGFLAALDDRIALLGEQTSTLEKIGAALFKSWFRDLDPVSDVETETEDWVQFDGRKTDAASNLVSEPGAYPSGWTVEKLGDVVRCVGGATPSTKAEALWAPEVYRWATPKDLSGASAPVLLDTARGISGKGLAKISSGLLPAGTLLMSSRAPVGYLSISAIPLAVNQGFIAMPPGGVLSPHYMFFWCKSNMEAIKQRANGSTFMEISKSSFRGMDVVVPPLKLRARFDEHIAPLMAKMTFNERYRVALQKFRDALLPRLLSGQILLKDRVPSTGEEFA